MPMIGFLVRIMSLEWLGCDILLVNFTSSGSLGNRPHCGFYGCGRNVCMYQSGAPCPHNGVLSKQAFSFSYPRGHLSHSTTC